MSREEYNKSIKDQNGLFCKNQYCSEKVITLEDGKYNKIHLCHLPAAVIFLYTNCFCFFGYSIGLFCKNQYCSEKVITLEDGKDGFCYICWRAYNAIHQATEYQERNERWKK